jgi:hypothetical protein
MLLASISYGKLVNQTYYIVSKALLTMDWRGTHFGAFVLVSLTAAYRI